MKSRKDVVIIHSNRIEYSTSFEEIPLSADQLVPLPPQAPDFLWRHNTSSKKDAGNLGNLVSKLLNLRAKFPHHPHC